MMEFHCVVQVAPSELPPKQTCTIGEKDVQGFLLPKLKTRFSKSFEAVSSDFNKLPRFFFEPDGSFVWVTEKERRYQLDGSLYDDGDLLLNVELKGCCDTEILDQFLTCLGWPEKKLIFQFVQQGIYVDEEEFRKHFVDR